MPLAPFERSNFTPLSISVVVCSLKASALDVADAVVEHHGERNSRDDDSARLKWSLSGCTTPGRPNVTVTAVPGSPSSGFAPERRHAFRVDRVDQD